LACPTLSPKLPTVLIGAISNSAAACFNSAQIGQQIGNNILITEQLPVFGD